VGDEAGAEVESTAEDKGYYNESDEDINDELNDGSGF